MELVDESHHLIENAEQDYGALLRVRSKVQDRDREGEKEKKARERESDNTLSLKGLGIA